ncbi:MAG TPA: tetratricopeptide repeat protein, partial [Bryobacteraceae bacterium]|nr:tetratricopeptide repeat protein [Bryobacteraceae bacterium]
MFCSSPGRVSAYLGLVLALYSGGCTRKPAGEVRRIAVLRFENLTSEPALEWMGRGLAEAVRAGLSGDAGTYAISFNTLHSLDKALGPQPVAAPGIAAEAQQALASGATRIVTGQYSLVRGTLRADVVERNLATGRTSLAFSESVPLREGAVSLAARIARRLSDTPRPPATRSDEALRQYALTFESPDPAARERALEQAVAADPGFGPAWTAAVELAVARRDRAAAARWLARARAQRTRLAEFDRARLDLLASMFDGDPSRQAQALATMSRLAPADPTIARSLAQVALQQRRYPDALAAFRKALEIEPENIETLNSMGYASAVAGDLDSATQALRRYAQLRPRDANPLDSLGDVHLYLGKLAEAEQNYLQAHQKSPAFLDGATLLKAAHTRLMTGEIGQADALFAKYRAERAAARDPLLLLREAEWSWACGRRREGLARLAEVAARFESGPLRDLAAEAYAELVFWDLELGNRDAARVHAAKAVAAAGPASAGAARVAHFLAQP